MRIRATFDAEGRAKGFYPDAVWPDNYPADAVEITQAQYDALLSSDAWRYMDGDLVKVEPEPETAPIPQSISRFQARAALLAADLLSDVEAAVAAADPFAQLAWAEAQEWRRDSPTLLALAHGIGLTDAEIDDLFVQAAAIRA